MNDVFNITSALLKSLQLDIVSEDRHRPWGGFFVLEEGQAKEFVQAFFPEEDYETLASGGKLSPKILMVAPGKRLSWQYHSRRNEIWRCVENDVAVATSDSNEETHKHTLHPGEIIKLPNGKRHRLIGLTNWGVVAEIWQHTNPHHASDEDDIVRLQDDFGR